MVVRNRGPILVRAAEAVDVDAAGEHGVEVGRRRDDGGEVDDRVGRGRVDDAPDLGRLAQVTPLDAQGLGRPAATAGRACEPAWSGGRAW